MHKNIGRLFACVVTVILLIASNAYAVEPNELITVDGPADGYSILSNGKRLYIRKPGTYTISNTDIDIAADLFIDVAITETNREITIILNGVNLQPREFAPIRCFYKCNLTIQLADNTTNILYSNDSYGIAVNNASTLTIQGNGILYVKGGVDAGPYNGYHYSGIGPSNITIENGTIFATGCSNAPGIGARNYTETYTFDGSLECYSDKTSNITINGGYVEAVGGEYAAGIGCGYDGEVENVVINGGTVIAKGGRNAAGIGGGYGSSTNGIYINGGKVIASSDMENGTTRSAAIGSGTLGSVQNLTISGGDITANTSEQYNAIGYYYGAEGNTCTINPSQGKTMLVKTGTGKDSIIKTASYSQETAISAVDVMNYVHITTGCSIHTGGKATCKREAICESCGNPYGDKDSANHVGETEVRGAVEPTYESEGYTGDTYCLDCGNIILQGTTIPRHSTYSVIVINGMADKDKYMEASTVTITADLPSENKQFSGWISEDGVSFTDASATTTTFAMPAKNVTVIATYEDLPPVEPAKYAVSVVNGTGDGEYAEGETVTITANPPAEGKQFFGWACEDAVSFADVSAQTTTFTMPAKAVTVTATYEEIPPATYAVTVNNGTGSGEYEEGKTVTITANAPAAGKRFAGWTSNDVSLTDANAATTTFVMPAKAVTVTANYTDRPVSIAYTVVYNANGGEGGMPNQYFNYGETKALLPNTFTREGYVFTGWNTKADGTGTAYADGQVVTMYNAVILYAQWKAEEKPIEPTPTPVPDPEVNPLVIIKHPADQIVAPGETAEFSILATGDGLAYQWYINRNDGLGWVKLHGATSAVHTTSAAELVFDGFQYACEVRDAQGNMARSNIAVLYVAAQPDVPETGDSTNLTLLCAMLFISCAGCLLLVKNRKRTSN